MDKYSLFYPQSQCSLRYICCWPVTWVDSWVGKIPSRRAWQPTLVFLPGEYPWTEVGCSPWCHEESDMTEQLHFYFSLSCIGEGNGNPLQCSCLENPRDHGGWWAAVYGVAQSRTRLKRLSSSTISVLAGPGNFFDSFEKPVSTVPM